MPQKKKKKQLFPPLLATENTNTKHTLLESGGPCSSRPPGGLRLNYNPSTTISESPVARGVPSFFFFFAAPPPPHVALRLSAVKLHCKETEELSECGKARLILYKAFGRGFSFTCRTLSP